MNLAESTPASADDWHLAELTQALRTPAVGRAMVLSERPEALAALGISDRCSVRTSADEAAVWQSLRCQHQALPVQAGSLDLLVLHEVLDGDQPELIAAARHCLRAGGRLLILAHGCLSPGRWRSAGRDCPRVRLGPLRHRLAQFGFESRRWHGRSIGGLTVASESRSNTYAALCIEWLYCEIFLTQSVKKIGFFIIFKW